MEQDHVGRLLAQWQQQRPDLNCSVMGIIGRAVRVNQLISKDLAKS